MQSIESILSENSYIQKEQESIDIRLNQEFFPFYYEIQQVIEPAYRQATKDALIDNLEKENFRKLYDAVKTISYELESQIPKQEKSE
jgi:hypothetical protein